jgi:hypothetical protein
LERLVALVLALVLTLAAAGCKDPDPPPVERVAATKQAGIIAVPVAVATTVSPSVSGEAVTFTATVTDVNGAPDTKATVTFSDGVKVLGTVPVDNAGKANLTIATLAVGSHKITATASTGGVGTVSQDVKEASTTAGVTSTVNPTIAGGSTTFEAAVTVDQPGTGTPTGSVKFREGANVLATIALDANGKASFSTSALAVGSHDIVVDYGGDSERGASTSPAVTQVVKLDGATLALTSSLNPSTFGASTTFTATVTSDASGGTPAGSVTFKDGGATLATVALAGGVATYATAALAGGSHTITADYGGDAKHDSASGSLTQDVGVGASTTALVSLANPSVFGEPVTLRATVSGTGATPTGTVTFSEGGTSIGSAAVNGAGQASITISTLSRATHSIVATYGGDASFGTSASAALSQQVTRAATTVTLISSSQPATVGSSVTFTATVTANAPGAGTPAGNVTFREGAATLGSGTLDAAGVVTMTTSTLALGTHTIRADYAGNTSYNASSSANLTQSVGRDGVTLSVSSSANPSTFGANVTFTATVTAAGTSGVPTGNVTFRDAGTALGTGTLDAGGVATFSTSALAGGTHSITVTYAGDTNHIGGGSAALSQVVNVASSTTVLASSSATSVFGQSITLTATVTSSSAGTRTGTVAFTDGGTTLATVAVNAAGIATHTTAALGVATHSLSALYSGDASFATSTGALSQVVNKAATTTALASSSNPSLIATSATFTATVTATAPGAGTAGGTVTFKDGATTLGTGTLDGSGVATYATSALALGTHSITAAYGGNASFVASTSAALAQNVNASAATIGMSTAANPSSYGDSVLVTVHVTGTNGAPTGTIVFKDGTATIGNGTLSGTGFATLSTSTLSAGAHTLSAVYSGDTTYATGTGTIAHVVNKATTTTTLVSSSNPAPNGGNVTFTVTVAPSAATGLVEFFDGTTSLHSVALANGTVAVSLTALTAGAHSITAKYAGDANFASSTSTALTQTVDAAPLGTSAPPGPELDAGYHGNQGVVQVSNGSDSCNVQASSPSSGGSGTPGAFAAAIAGAALVMARRRARAQRVRSLCGRAEEKAPRAE